MDKSIERFLGIALFVAVVIVLYGLLQVPLLRFANQAANQPANDQADVVDATRSSRVDEIVIHSSLLHKTLPVRVYVPAIRSSKETLLPVIYMLHGTPGDYRDWLDLGNAKSILDESIARGDLPSVIAVFPEVDNDPSQATEFVNRRDGTAPIMDYLATELPQYIETHYHASTMRAIIGLSEGGYGAVNIAIHYQDRFPYAASLSGYFVARDIADNNFAFGHDVAYARVQSPLYWIKDQPTVKLPALYLASESGDEYGQELNNFQSELAKQNIQASIQFANGEHGWDLWRSQLPDVLKWLGRYFNPLVAK